MPRAACHSEAPEETQREADGEAGSMHREPDVGLDPGSPESGPGPRAALNRWATQAAQLIMLLSKYPGVELLQEKPPLRNVTEVAVAVCMPNNKLYIYPSLNIKHRLLYEASSDNTNLQMTKENYLLLEELAEGMRRNDPEKAVNGIFKDTGIPWDAWVAQRFGACLWPRV
uniref:uncharacterized protein LOC129503957 n=1 Tax=Nyctereutes procyonoides TaxID=34880 RepID=UPI0024443330|nr:uncharacterized protein LOC129503957 [Nyctereutes procyonoides]